MSKLSLILRPADVLMFRDSRPFGTDGGQAVSEHAPTPRTLAGALRAWLMAASKVNLEQFRRQAAGQQGALDFTQALPEEQRWIAEVRFQGPFLWMAAQTYYHAPVTLVKRRGAKGELARLVPRGCAEVPGWKPPEEASGLRPLGLEDGGEWEPLESPCWLNHWQLRDLLNGHEPPCEQNLVGPDKVFCAEARTGITTDPGRRAVEEGLIYSAVFTRLQPGWAIRVDLTYPEKAQEHVAEALQELPWLRLGGEKRAVHVEQEEWQEHPSVHTTDGRVLLYLATPGRFAEGWLPKALQSAALVAAAAGKPVAFSGWDLARRRPEPSRWATPAGAMYFLEDELPESDNDCLSDEPADRQTGWGVALKGTW